MWIVLTALCLILAFALGAEVTLIFLKRAAMCRTVPELFGKVIEPRAAPSLKGPVLPNASNRRYDLGERMEQTKPCLQLIR